jgi:hypothetical protein
VLLDALAGTITMQHMAALSACNFTGPTLVPTVLVAGLPTNLVRACRTICLAERWRLGEATTLAQLRLCVEATAPWVIVLPPVLDGLTAGEVRGHVRFGMGAHDAALIGFVAPEDGHGEPATAIPGFDVCLRQDAAADTLRTHLIGLVEIVAVRRRLRVRAGRRAADYAGPRRRRSDVSC